MMKKSQIPKLDNLAKEVKRFIHGNRSPMEKLLHCLLLPHS